MNSSPSKPNNLVSIVCEILEAVILEDPVRNLLHLLLAKGGDSNTDRESI
jgi:hypothetical protein